MGGAHVSARTLLLTFLWILLCTSSIGHYCGHPGKPAFSEFDPSDVYEVGRRVSYECIDGYELNSPFRSSSQFSNFGQRECLPDGTWSHDNVYCYKRLPAQKSRCDWNKDKYQCSLKSGTVSDLLIITSMYQLDISGLSMYDCGTYFYKVHFFNTSSALFRIYLDKIPGRCRPHLHNFFIETKYWDEILVTPYARNHLCGTPETPANGKLFRVNAITVRHVCDSGYQLKGNEYRNCVDGFWYGNQVICNKTAEQNKSDQFTRSTLAVTQTVYTKTTERNKNDQFSRSPLDVTKVIFNKTAEQNKSDQFSLSPLNGTRVICNKTAGRNESDQFSRSPWNGTQVLCYNIAEQNESDQFYLSSWNETQDIWNEITDENEYYQFISFPPDAFHIISMAGLALAALAMLSICVMCCMMKRMGKQRDYSQLDTLISTTKNAKIVDIPVDTARVYYTKQDNKVPESDDLYEAPIQFSATRPL